MGLLNWAKKVGQKALQKVSEFVGEVAQETVQDVGQWLGINPPPTHQISGHSQPVHVTVKNESISPVNSNFNAIVEQNRSLISSFAEHQKRMDNLAVQRLQFDQERLKIEANIAKEKDNNEKALIVLRAEIAQIEHLDREKANQLKAQELQLIEAWNKTQAQLKKEELRLSALAIKKQEEMALAEQKFQAQQSAIHRSFLKEQQIQEFAQRNQEIKTKIQADWDQQGKLPTILSRAEIETILGNNQDIRLLVLLSKPEIANSCPDFFKDDLGMEVENNVKMFMQKHYAKNNPVASVQFYSRFFDKAVFDAHATQVESIIGHVPTVIIFSNINSRNIYFHIHCWGWQNKNLVPFSKSVNWKKLESLFQQELDNLANVDLTEIHEVISDFIVTMNQTIASFITDLYYLTEVDPYYQPQLFNLDFGLPQEFKDLYIKPWVDLLRQIQQQQLEELRKIAEQKRITQEKIINQEKNRLQKFSCIHTISGHSNSVDSVAFSPNGQYLASGSADDNIKLWQVGTWREIRIFTGHSDFVRSVTFSPDGKFLASGSRDKTIKIWEVNTGKLIRTLFGHSDDIKLVTWSLDGQLLASGSSDKTIKFWQVSTGEIVRTILSGYSDRVNSVAFSPDGKLLASGGSGGGIKTWEVTTGKEIKCFDTGGSWSVTFSPNGEYLAGDINTRIEVWQLTTKEKIYTCNLGDKNSVWSIAFYPDGQFLASGSHDQTVKIWQLATETEICTLEGHSHSVQSVAFSPDGQFLASGSIDHTIKIWGVK